MPDIEIPIGRLRWRVIVARRRLEFDPPGGVGIYEDYVAVQTVHADVQPIKELTFYGAEQVDTPVTHRITTRWLDSLDNTNVFIRDTRRNDGSVRRELFRVRRIKELNGRKRFTSVDVELEKVDSQPPGSAA